jgi:hypothetical protein
VVLDGNTKSPVEKVPGVTFAAATALAVIPVKLAPLPVKLTAATTPPEKMPEDAEMLLPVVLVNVPLEAVSALSTAIPLAWLNL